MTALALLIAALLVGVVSPGPSFVMVARTAVASSRAHGLHAALGMGVGGTCFAGAALLGLQAVLLAVPALYLALKVLGGLYLCYLGVRIFLAARVPLAIDGHAAAAAPAPASRAFWLGLVTQLSNPKTAIVYASVFAALLPASISLPFAVAVRAGRIHRRDRLVRDRGLGAVVGGPAAGLPELQAGSRPGRRRGHVWAGTAADHRRAHVGGHMATEPDAPFHAHVYFTLQTREQAVDLRNRLLVTLAPAPTRGVRFVGELREFKVGPHPLAQFEVHFDESWLPRILPTLRASGLTVLVHPLTQDDHADHTSLARWIGEPLDLDLSVLDPPGMNQGFERYGKRDL